MTAAISSAVGTFLSFPKEGINVTSRLEQTFICVVDAECAVIRRDVVASESHAPGKWFDRHCPDLARVVLETGILATFLYHGLTERGLPVECIQSRGSM